MNCKKCGAVMADPVKFCGVCGVQIHQGTVEGSPSAPPLSEDQTGELGSAELAATTGPTGGSAALPPQTAKRLTVDAIRVITLRGVKSMVWGLNQTENILGRGITSVSSYGDKLGPQSHQKTFHLIALVLIGFLITVGECLLLITREVRKAVARLLSEEHGQVAPVISDLKWCPKHFLIIAIGIFAIWGVSSWRGPSEGAVYGAETATTSSLDHAQRLAAGFRQRMLQGPTCGMLADQIDRIADSDLPENIRVTQIEGYFGAAMRSGCLR
jgi:hypothetical protein